MYPKPKRMEIAESKKYRFKRMIQNTMNSRLMRNSKGTNRLNTAKFGAFMGEM
jgi:hypothetical protein